MTALEALGFKQKVFDLFLIVLFQIHSGGVSRQNDKNGVTVQTLEDLTVLPQRRCYSSLMSAEAGGVSLAEVPCRPTGPEVRNKEKHYGLCSLKKDKQKHNETLHHRMINLRSTTN